MKTGLRPGAFVAIAVGIAAAVAVGRGAMGSSGDPRAMASPPVVPPGAARATFAGGCFWCMESPYDSLPGVLSVTSGYTGGRFENPTYEQVSSGGTGHAEAVQIVYDPAKITYEKLLDVYWHNVDPTVRDRQFCDVGEQYRTGIFVHDAAQRKAAEASKADHERTKPFKEPIVTTIEDAGAFWPAYAYLLGYCKLNPLQYRMYRSGCGRDARLAELWGRPIH
jgi:peptide-methionine (S)-S-oxide reductase